MIKSQVVQKVWVALEAARPKRHPSLPMNTGAYRGDMGVFQNQGYLFGGPYKKDYSILGSILGSPYFEKLPYRDIGPKNGESN